MDQIQKALIQAGRKDLAQQYYKKIGKKAGIQELSGGQSRLKKLREIKSNIDFLTEELGSALKNVIDKSDVRMDDLEKVTFLEHFFIRAMRTLPTLSKDIEDFQKYLKAKIDFLKK